MTTGHDELLRHAQAGNEAVLGPLFNHFRAQLRWQAQKGLGPQLHSKVDPSDLVQDTFLQAHRHFAQFQGRTENELLAWLRQILTATLANVVRHYVGTQGRDVRLERSLEQEVDRSSQDVPRALAAHDSTPSQQAAHKEQMVLLAQALGHLPEDYRQVLVLRHLEGLTFAEVARRMGRTQDSVDKLWLRALARLRPMLKEAPPPPSGDDRGSSHD
jgi:RNA polymerase sigma-70 factor (ECF subfamily)